MQDLNRVFGYEQTIEIKMQRQFSTLSEKDKCRYADIETMKLDYSDINYISKLFDIVPSGHESAGITPADKKPRRDVGVAPVTFTVKRSDSGIRLG